MPDMVSDIVDVYVFRRLSARVQFLLLQRRANVPLGNTWQSFHTQIRQEESTIAAGRRAVRELAGLNVSEVYSADYINEFYDDMRDVVVLAPVLAVNVSPQAPVTLGPEFRDCAWWDTNQAVARLPFAGQRWAVRHIDEIMSIGHAESQLYRLQLPSEDPRPFNDEALAAIRETDEPPAAPDSFESFAARLDEELPAGDDDPEELPAIDEPGHRTNVP
jgi:dATP pyrophosphohydrolase